MSRHTVARLGLALFLVSWFLPVHEGLHGHDGSIYGADATLGFAAGTPPGWRACRMAWDMLVEEAPEPEAASDAAGQAWSVRLLGATCLTNGVMLVFALLTFASAVRGRLTANVLLLCAIMNAGWIYLNLEDGEFLGGLQIGYFLWTASFLLAAVGAVRFRGA